MYVVCVLQKSKNIEAYTDTRTFFDISWNDRSSYLNAKVDKSIRLLAIKVKSMLKKMWKSGNTKTAEHNPPET